MWVWCECEADIEKPVWFSGLLTTRAHPARSQRLKEILIQYFVSKLTYMDPQYQIWVMNTK